MKWPQKYLWVGLGFGCWLVILLTIPLIFTKSKIRQFDFKYEFLPLGVIPKVNADYAATQSAFLDQLTATNLQVTDLNSGAVLLQKNATTSAFPASTTKILTALVAKDIYELDRPLLVTKEALRNDNLLKFYVGEQILAGDLIKALLINSSNESAEVLALNSDLGKVGFVDLMNQKARALNLNQSLFVNPAGFDDENIYSTARDLTILAKELLKDSWLKEVVSTKSVIISEASGSAKHVLTNTNQLLFEHDEVRGVKTGTTQGAGQVLITLIEKDTHQLLIVLMGSEDRYLDTKMIMSWLEQAIEWESFEFNNLIN